MGWRLPLVELWIPHIHTDQVAAAAHHQTGPPECLEVPRMHEGHSQGVTVRLRESCRILTLYG